MLPDLRTITVGGVFLAFAIFALALQPPDGSRAHFSRGSTSPRGPLIDRAAHPEWRQMLLLAAFRRAAELKELRNIPDTPQSLLPTPDSTAENKAGIQLAALPIDGYPGSGAPDGPTTIPLGIGEASSTELPVVPHEERPPVVTISTPGESVAPSQPAPEPAPRQAIHPPATVSAPQAHEDKALPPQAVPKPAQQHAIRHKKPDTPPASTGELKPLKVIVPAQPAPEPIQRQQAMRQDKPDLPPASTAKIKPLEIIVPPQPAPKPAQRQAMRRDQPALPPASTAEIKPLEIIVPPQPASEPAQRQAMRQDKPDLPSVSTDEIKPLEIIVPRQPAPKPAVATATPSPAHAKPAAATAQPPAARANPQQRPGRTARGRHTRTAKPAKTTSAQQQPFNLFAILFGGLNTDAERHSPRNRRAAKHKRASRPAVHRR